MMIMMRSSLIQHNALHTCYCFLLLFLLSLSSSSEAYDALDPYGNITIKWDLVEWQADGYIAAVTINNYQQYRHIPTPGWSLTWKWAEKELIWNITGAMTTEQGNCSWFKGYHPLSCKKSPTVVDLLPSTPYKQKVPNCCKGGILTSLAQDPSNAVASFQLTVGRAGTTNRTVRVPRNFTFNAPGSGYSCGMPKIVRPTLFITPDKRRVTQALMTWNVTCTYSHFLAENGAPTCCVSLSSFYNDTRVPCPTCSCACKTNSTCVKANLSPVVSGTGKNPLVECSNHMCPINVHWHLNLNNKDYWRVNVTITNFSYRMNYSDWNLLIQHPNFNNNNLTQVFGLKYKLLAPSDEHMAMFWGIKFYNNVLIEAGPHGNNVEFEVLFRKDNLTLGSNKGWAFPQGVYFNGDQCVMPSPHAYPWLPSA